MVERDGRGRIVVRPRPRRKVEIRDFSAATSAEPVDCPVLRQSYPTMWRAMQTRGYQTLVVAFAKRVGCHFNGSQPGVGKTIETLGALAECGRSGNILVIAPKKAIQATWPREIEKWLAPDASCSVLVCDSEQGSMPERNALLDAFSRNPGSAKFRFILIHPEMLTWDFICDYVKPGGRKCNGQSRTCPKRKQHAKASRYPALFKIAWDAIIMDETHKFMMHANERAATKSGWGYGAQKLKGSYDCMKIGMSGTPFKGRPRRFWPMLHWLRPDIYGSQHKWERWLFETVYDFWSSTNEKITDKFREGHEELFNKDLDRIMIRHTKRELRKINPAWAPPEKVYVEVKLPMEPRQRRAYQGMLKDATAQLLNGELTANGILAERTRLRQLASSFGRLDADGRFAPSLPSNKWEWIVNALEERGLAKGMNDGDVKIVITSSFTSLLDVMSDELDRIGIKHYVIKGPTRNVKAIEDEWQSEQTQTRVLLLGKASGGYSLTLDAADDLVNVEPAENPDDDEQAEDRVHRTSCTDHQVTIYNLISDDSIEVSIASGNLAMDVTQKSVLDGRRGVEFARLTLEGGGDTS